MRPLAPMSVDALRHEVEEALDDVIRARRRLEFVISGLAAHDTATPDACGRIVALTSEIRSHVGKVTSTASILHRRAQRQQACAYGYTRPDDTPTSSEVTA